MVLLSFHLQAQSSPEPAAREDYVFAKPRKLCQGAYRSEVRAFA